MMQWMLVISTIEPSPGPLSHPVVTIGNFDGVHRGHLRLVDRLRLVAARAKGVSVVITFRPHPVRVLRPDRAPPLITSYERKLTLLEAAGVDVVWQLPFDRDFSEWPARRFIDELLVRGLGVRHVVCGPDCRFGKDRRGDAALLAEVGKSAGFSVQSVSPLVLDGRVVSSSRIRRLVTDEGDVGTAAELLGRPASLRGIVARGEQRGRTIGFPTANLRPEPGLIPRIGVYAARARLGPSLEQPAEVFDAVVNIGVKPTFGTSSLTIEAHLFDFDRDVYGAQLELSFVSRIRGERRFDGVDALVAQIHRDAAVAREQLHR